MRYFCGDIKDVQTFATSGFRRTRATCCFLSTACVRFANDTVGASEPPRRLRVGPRRLRSAEVAGKAHSASKLCGEADVLAWARAEPEVMNTGVTDFGTTFPNRIHRIST